MKVLDAEFVKGFIRIIGRPVIYDLVTAAALGEQIFRFTIPIVGNNRIGCVKNIFCGSVVLFQPYNLGTGEIFFEIPYIFNSCSAESINTLIVVSHNA